MRLPVRENERKNERKMKGKQTRGKQGGDGFEKIRKSSAIRVSHVKDDR